MQYYNFLELQNCNNSFNLSNLREEGACVKENNVEESLYGMK